MRTTTYNVMEYYEFENLVTKTYGAEEYSFPADMETSNDSIEEFNHMKKEPLDQYKMQSLEEFKTTGNIIG